MDVLNLTDREVTERWGMIGSGHECKPSDRGESTMEIVRRRFQVTMGEENVHSVRS